MTTYYITGLGGFVGCNLLNELKGEKIIAFILPSERSPPEKVTR